MLKNVCHYKKYYPEILVAYNTLKEHQNYYSFDLIRDILSGKYGFMYQYDRKLMLIQFGLLSMILRIMRFVELKEIQEEKNLKKI